MTWSKLALKYHSQLWHLKLSTVSSLLFLVTSNYTQRSLCTLCHWQVPLTLICSNPSQPVCISCMWWACSPRLAKVTQLHINSDSQLLALHSTCSPAVVGLGPGAQDRLQLHSYTPCLPAQASKGCLESPTIKHTTMLLDVFS